MDGKESKMGGETYMGESEMIHFEPCPFCGGDIFTLKSTYAPYIKCEACGTMKTGDTLDECIEKWNRRAIE